MKKKLFLMLIMAVIFAVTLAVAVFADSVHNENTVDYSATVTLNDGTVCPLYDSDKNALIWYIVGKDESGNTVYDSIRADDPQVRYYTENWDEVTGFSIQLNDGSSYNNSTFVVVNLMDDDVVKNSGPGEKHYGKPVTGFKFIFQGARNLEYCYLRLDTTNIQKQSFNGCSKLKYVNLESLTKLVRIGDNDNFANCTSLFEGQVIDLRNTSLKEIDWGGSFKNVPFVGIKLPNTITRLYGSFEGSGLTTMSFPIKLSTMEGSMFKNCKSLTSVALYGNLTKINDNAFLNCTALEKVFFVGTLDQLNTLLLGVSATGNDAFLAVAGENNANVISYAEYKKLSDKSGKYMVYDYSYCEAYTDGNHTVDEANAINACVGTCSVCNNDVVSHSQNAQTSVRADFENGFMQAGQKVIFCNNEGCTYKTTEALMPLFACLGYSASKTGNGISLGFKVDSQAIAAYKEVSGNTLVYGVFAIAQSKLDGNKIFDENGKANEFAITAEIKATNFSAFDIKIVGFENDTQKSSKLALGAYVALSNGEISYMQAEAPSEGDGYHFVSYNDIVKY